MECKWSSLVFGFHQYFVLLVFHFYNKKKFFVSNLDGQILFFLKKIEFFPVGTSSIYTICDAVELLTRFVLKPKKTQYFFPFFLSVIEESHQSLQYQNVVIINNGWYDIYKCFITFFIISSKNNLKWAFFISVQELIATMENTRSQEYVVMPEEECINRNFLCDFFPLLCTRKNSKVKKKFFSKNFFAQDGFYYHFRQKIFFGFALVWVKKKFNLFLTFEFCKKSF